MTFPKYHKINSIFKRDMTKKNKPLILGDFTLPEFEHLNDAVVAARKTEDFKRVRDAVVAARKKLHMLG